MLENKRNSEKCKRKTGRIVRYSKVGRKSYSEKWGANGRKNHTWFDRWAGVLKGKGAGCKISDSAKISTVMSSHNTSAKREKPL